MLGIVMGYVGKDPDAQGSGSEKRDLLGASRNQSQRNPASKPKSENKQGLGRGKVVRTRAGV